MYDDGDILLYMLSGWKEARWASFKKAFDEVYRKRSSLKTLGETEPELVRYERMRAARLLASLGHYDFYFSEGEGRLFAAPAVLAALPSPGLPRAVLCGARSPSTVATIRRACAKQGRALRLEIISQMDRALYAPSRIEITGESHRALHHLASTLGIRYDPVPSAWTIAEFSGSVTNYLESLQWTREPELNWEREDFDPKHLQFAGPVMDGMRVRLSRYRDPARLIWTYRMHRDAMSAEVSADWGRYAILQETGTQVLLYNERAGELAVPRGAPLPLLLARALALCSGLAPRFVTRNAVHGNSPEHLGFDLYAAVPPDVLSVIALKSGQVGKPMRLVLKEESR